MSNSQTPLLVVFKVWGIGFFVVFNLIWIDHGVTCFFPGLDTPCEAFYVFISLFEVLGCLTGSAFFFRSGTVENDLLIFR